MTLIESAEKVANNIREYSLAIADTDIDAALRVARGYGQFLWANNVGVFADSEFENLLVEHLTWLLKGRVKQGGFDTLHLMTTAHTSGGHTGVVERLLGIGIGDGLAILDKLPGSDLKQLPNGNGIKVFNGIRKESGTATISEILEIGLKFKNVILHIHPNDIYSAIAAMLLVKLGVKVFMYNHADHVFSFGYSAAQKVFEISKYGWVRGALRGIEHKQTFVGIPIPTDNVRPVKYRETTPKQIFMAGSANKFMPWANYSVPEFINQIHKKEIGGNRLKITICGPTGREKYWQSLNADARRHIKFLGQRPHAEYLKLLLTCDCYIDSFPVANGTGFVESVMQGIPSFGLDLYAGYSCADVLRSHSVEDLVEALASYMENRGAVYHRLLEVREQVILEQSAEVCGERVRCAMESQSNIPLLGGLASTRCMEDYFERYWESSQKIHINLSILSGLRLVQQIKLIKCWSDAWPYGSIALSSGLERLINDKVKGMFASDENAL